MTSITSFRPAALQFGDTKQPADNFVVRESNQWVIYEMKDGHASFVRKLGVGASKPGLNEKTTTELSNLLPPESDG